MSSTRPQGVRTWIELDRAAIVHNYNTLRGLVDKKTLFMAVIKSNAYGHGLLDFGLEIDKLGPDFIGVDSIVEATALRKAGITRPLFVLGFTLPEMLAQAAGQNISLAISSFEGLAAIASEYDKAPFAAPLKIHVKVDTGMHRQGFQENEIEQVIEQLKKLEVEKKIVVEGLFTHLAASKTASFRDRTLQQLAQFNMWREAFTKAGFSPITHSAATGGAVVFPESHFDLVRVGGGLYDLWPSVDNEPELAKKIGLKPVLTWKTLVSEIKNVPKGDCVGYDFTEEFSRDCRIAVCPIGYWHGYPRSLSSVGSVLIKGKWAKVLGRVSMDMMVVDVTDIPEAEVLDEVVLVGQQGNEEMTMGRLAKIAGILDYELSTRLNPLIKRIVL